MERAIATDDSTRNAQPGWSLHLRLAAGLALCIGGVFAVLFPALDIWIDHEIHQRMDLTLSQRAGVIARVLQERNPRELARLMPEYQIQGHTEFFTVFDADGRQPLLLSPNSAGIALSPGSAAQDTPRHFDLTLPDGHAGRALATPLPAQEKGGEACLLVVATERADWDRTEDRIHVALLACIALATVLATGLALWLIQRVILLLRRAGATVATLDADAPARPIGQDFPRELRPFAEAFNMGLRHLYAAIARERRFSRDVAHELRTPLAEIRASAESALSDDDPARARESLDAAIAACARMQRSVDTLMLLARLESGQHLLAPDPLDLAALLRAALVSLGQRQASGEVSIRAELPPSAWIRSDLGIIERIVSNLLRNAFEYSPPGAEIACRLVREQPGWLLSISNAAPELDQADVERLGERFWRKHSEGGTAHHAGLGLALTFALTQAVSLPLRFHLHEGRLTACLGPWPALV